jgi:hypothetical protein
MVKMGLCWRRSEKNATESAACGIEGYIRISKRDADGNDGAGEKAAGFHL